MNSPKLLNLLLFGFLVLLTFSFNYRLPADPDLGWHLRYGREVVENKKILTIDTFSHTYNGSPYVDSSWVFDGVIYWIYMHWSFNGLVLSSMIFTSLAFLVPLIVFESSAIIKILLLTIALYGSSGVTDAGIRSQNCSLVFFSFIVTFTLQYLRKRKLKWLLPIPVFLLIWANVHSGYFLGLVYLFLLFFLELTTFLFNKLRKKDEGNICREPIIALGVIIVISYLVSGLRPMGSSGGNNGLFQLILSIFFPVNLATNIPVVGSLRTTIQEWLPPIFWDFPGTIFLLSIIFSVGLFIQKAKIHDNIKLLVILLFFIYFSTLSRRNIPYFFIASLPILFIRFNDVKIKIKETVIFPLVTKLLVISLLVVSLMMLYRNNEIIKKNSSSLQSYCEYLKYPCSAVEFIKKQKPKGNMFNPYDWGGYLIWQLPEYPVFIDGRVPASEIFAEYETINRLNNGWQEILKKYDIQWMIIPSDSLFEQVVNIDNGWKKAYYDRLTTVLIKNEKNEK